MFVEETQLENHLKTISTPNWNRLFTFIPTLQQKTVFGRWEGSDQNPYIVPDAEVGRFSDTVHDLGLMVFFDWTGWSKGKEAWMNKSYDFTQMTLPELCKMITMLVRGDRFNEGLLVEAFDRGVMLRILLAIRQKIPFQDE